MRDRRTALVKVLVAVLVATVGGACDLGPQADERPSSGPTLVAVDEGGGGVPPELTEDIEVELGTAVAVLGLGCRPQSPHQRCSADGSKTYVLTGGLHAATVTAAWMQLDAGRGRWTVNVRLAPDDRATAAIVARRARSVGGLVVVLDAHTGDVLTSASPNDVRAGRIIGRHLQKPTANSVVNAFVTAATGR